jgi:hypothetical protein
MWWSGSRRLAGVLLRCLLRRHAAASHCGILQRRLSGGGAQKATGAYCSFCCGCEGEEANMQASTGSR